MSSIIDAVEQVVAPLGAGSRQNIRGDNKKPEGARRSFGAGKQAGGICPLTKIPKTKYVFGARSKTDPGGPATFFYPDYTVGPGITPGHAFLARPPKGERRLAQRGSWAVPPIGNSLALCFVQVSPCPEG